MEIPIVDRSDVVLGQRLATGAGGIVYEGRMKTDSGWKEVAIKEIPVSIAGEEYKAELKSVATTAFIAGENTHVCKVYGLSWGEKDCWYVHPLQRTYCCLVPGTTTSLRADEYVAYILNSSQSQT
jgi:hypothetical protein